MLLLQTGLKRLHVDVVRRCLAEVSKQAEQSKNPPLQKNFKQGVDLAKADA